MRCFDCKKDVSGKEKEQCKEANHDLDYENLYDGKKLKQQEKDERTASKKCYDFAMTKIKKLVISENNSEDVYAVVEVNSHVEAINLSSTRARYWLSDEYSKNIESNEIHADDFFKTVLNHIIAKAQMNGTERTQIHNRIAQSDDALIYDLGTPDWQFIKVTKDGIKTVKFDTGLPIFRRTQSLQKQVMPKEGNDGALDKLVELLRIVPRDRLVFKVHTVALFLSAYPVPMVVFDGTAGSLKTTATATVKRIVDPNGVEKEDNVSAMAEKHDDLILQLQNRYLPSFDNVGSISPKTSDILCRAITGSNNHRRKLYTDDDESIHSFKRKIVLNGIVPYLDYPDLQTRLVIYARELVDETNRMTEQEFKTKFEELLPFVLGQIFITFCKALREYPNLKDGIRPKTRMSDFEIWGEVISRVLGHPKNEFLNRYREKLSEGNISSQDSYPIVNAIQSFMDERESWENTASSLYQHLVTVAQDQGVDLQSKYVRFPKSSNKLTRELTIVDSLLRNLGFVIQIYHYSKNDGRFTKNSTIIKITRRSSQYGLFSGVSSPYSPSSPLPDSGTKSGEDTSEDTQPQDDARSPKEANFTHENITGEHGDDGEHHPGNHSKAKQFFCDTHNAGPFSIDATSKSSGSILEFHRKLGCQIKYMEKEDV